MGLFQKSDHVLPLASAEGLEVLSSMLPPKADCVGFWREMRVRTFQPLPKGNGNQNSNSPTTRISKPTVLVVPPLGKGFSASGTIFRRKYLLILQLGRSTFSSEVERLDGAVKCLVGAAVNRILLGFRTITVW